MYHLLSEKLEALQSRRPDFKEAMVRCTPTPKPRTRIRKQGRRIDFISCAGRTRLWPPYY